jgi:uncharacterized protein YecE (DUF72 family)
MKLSVGTSGFSYKEWKGSFYPEDLAASKMLRFYAGRFPTVEINNTFYRMPKVKTLEQWRSEVPAGFIFALKASQRITHIQRLKDAADSVDYFFRTAKALGKDRGPTLFQLPPNMKKDLERLRLFLALLPGEARAAFEFRHESWFDEEVFAALREKEAALCIAQSDDFECPSVITAPFAYLRLRRTQYSDAELRDWSRRIEALGVDEAFVYFKHEDSGTGPQWAEQLQSLASKRQK